MNAPIQTEFTQNTREASAVVVKHRINSGWHAAHGAPAWFWRLSTQQPPSVRPSRALAKLSAFVPALQAATGIALSL